MADRNLRIRMLLEAADKATKPLRDLGTSSSRASKALDKTRQRLAALNREQSNIEAFRKCRRAVSSLGEQVTNARSRVRELQQQIDATDNPTKKMQRAFEAAKRSLVDLKSAQARENVELEKARAAMKAAGIDTTRLSEHEESLERRIAATNREIAQRSKVLARAQRLGSAIGAGSSALNRGTHRATNSFATGTTMVFEGAALAEGLKKPIEEAVDLQDKMAGVRKVAQMESPAIRRMTEDYVHLSEVMPIAVDEFADMAEKAAAAGVGRDKHGAAMKDQRQQIEDFTVQAGKMAVAFNITKEEAGTTMMAWREAFQLPLPKLRELGDQVNTLNKYFGGSPAEINEVLERIGSLGGVAGAQAAQIAAMASSLSSLHIAADVSATGLKNVLVQFNAGDSATKKLRKAFKAVGLDAKEVAKSMQKDAGGTILDVFTRISRLPKFQQVAELRNMFGKESITAIAPLLSNLSGLRERMEKVGNATEYAGSVQKEYDIRNDTTAAKLKIAKNNFQDLAITIGTTLLPAVNALAIKFGAGAKALSDFASRHPTVVKALAAMAVIIGTLTAIGGVFFIMRAAVIGLMAPFTALNAVLAAFDIALLPVYGTIFGIIAVIALLAAGVYLIYRNWGPIAAFFGSLWDGIKAIFAAAGQTLSGVWQGMWSGMAAISATSLSGIIASIGYFVGSALGALVRFGFNAFAWLTGTLPTLLVSGWQAAFSLFTGAVTGGLTWLTTTLPAILSSGWNIAWSTFKSAIYAAFVALPTMFASFGSMIVRGLINGITGGLKGIWSLGTTLAGSLVKGFTDRTKIQSPSRVFHALGGHIIAGLSNGINDRRRAPVERIKRVAGAMEQQMRVAPLQAHIGGLSRRVGTALAIGAAMPAAAAPIARAPAPIAAPATPRPIEIHIHQQPGQSAQDMAHAVAAELDRREREKAAKRRSSYTDQQDWE